MQALIIKSNKWFDIYNHNDVIKYEVTYNSIWIAITNDVIKYAIKNDYAITNDVIKYAITNEAKNMQSQMI